MLKKNTKTISNMIPKEKALQLVDKYIELIDINNDTYWFTAKKLAMLCVNEQLEFMNHLGWKPLENGNVDYWQEVKDELNQL